MNSTPADHMVLARAMQTLHLATREAASRGTSLVRSLISKLLGGRLVSEWEWASWVRLAVVGPLMELAMESSRLAKV